jgi:hypothetical protein
MYANATRLAQEFSLGGWLRSSLQRREPFKARFYLLVIGGHKSHICSGHQEGVEFEEMRDDAGRGSLKIGAPSYFGDFAPSQAINLGRLNLYHPAASVDSSHAH